MNIVLSKLKPNKQLIFHTNKRLASFSDLFGGSKKTENIDFKTSPIEKEENLVEKQPETLQPARLSRVKAYKPSDDVAIRIKSLIKEIYGNEFNETNFTQIKLTDAVNKFNLLSKCIKEFNHNIPNTSLNDIKSVDDLITYYLTEQKDTSTLEDLKQQTDLPPNLHINLDYNRYDPATDVFFGGRDAYPERDTIVTSLWYSKKYKSVIKKKDYFKK